MQLYELNPIQRFSDRADDYARYRPDYPDEAIAEILEGLGDPKRLLAVDVGAGTGISSRRLAAHGVRVIAVEPNTPMRETAEPHPLVKFIEARAEALPFEDASVDLAACFQAFHWFRPAEALQEFHRILKDRGRVAVVWNERDHCDPFTGDYGRVVRHLSRDHPAEQREQTIDALLRSPIFADVQHFTFAYQQRLTLAGLIGRARSASYLPADGENFEELIRELSALHQRWGDERGAVTLVYRTEVYLAARALADGPASYSTDRATR